MQEDFIDIKLEDGGILPSKEFPNSIGYDLYVPEDTVIPKGRSVVPLNFRIKLPKGYGAFIFGRSGMVAKGMKGLNIFDHFVECRFDCDAKLGLVDPKYGGIVGVLVHNHEMPFKMKAGDPIAQMVFIKCESPFLRVVNHFEQDKERGEQGFNS